MADIARIATDGRDDVVATRRVRRAGTVHHGIRRPPPARGSGASPLWARKLGRAMFLVPALVYLALLFAYPLVYNVLLSLRQAGVIGFINDSAKFAGLANYKSALSNPALPTVVVNTAIFLVASLVVQFVIGFGLALFFTRRFPLSGLLRALILVPWLLPGVVTGSILRFMFDTSDGMINQILKDVGIIHTPIQWLSDPHLALVTVVIANIWVGIPFNMLLLHGGIQEIPRELYEAGRVDGAGTFRLFRSITVPMLRPVIAVVLILGFIYTLKAFDIIIVMTGGGPINGSQLLSTWAYTLSFTNLDFGQGAAVGTIMMLISLVCAVIYTRIYRGGEAK
jgi:multiple sugar transport system permease protein